MATYADIIQQSRVLLQDLVVPYRYTNEELLVGANDAVMFIRKNRPDTFYGKFNTAITVAQLTDTVPLSPEYHMVIRNYVVAHAQLRDAEDSSSSKAATFLALFEKGIVLL